MGTNTYWFPTHPGTGAETCSTSCASRAIRSPSSTAEIYGSRGPEPVLRPGANGLGLRRLRRSWWGEHYLDYDDFLSLWRAPRRPPPLPLPRARPRSRSNGVAALSRGQTTLPDQHIREGVVWSGRSKKRFRSADRPRHPQVPERRLICSTTRLTARRTPRICERRPSSGVPPPAREGKRGGGRGPPSHRYGGESPRLRFASAATCPTPSRNGRRPGLRGRCVAGAHLDRGRRRVRRRAPAAHRRPAWSGAALRARSGFQALNSFSWGLRGPMERTAGRGASRGKRGPHRPGSTCSRPGHGGRGARTAIH